LPYNKRTLVALLDRPGGRFLLGKIATRFARRATGLDVQILYLNGLWTHRVGNCFFPDGTRFNFTSPDFERWPGQQQRYVSEAEDFWLQYYRPKTGDVIIDIGAGRGEDMLTFSNAVGPTGRVIAVEAHPLSFAILKSFCRLNGLTNAAPLHLALMDRPGTVHIAGSESAWDESAVQVGNEPAGIEVRADTLDNLCIEQGVREIAFLKMNIEGAERQALPGMEATLPHIRTICVACHDFRADWGHGEQFRTRAFVEQFLVEHGFVLKSRRDDPRGYVRDHVFGSRP
jgi:FkbM family methyltransferase